jgi:putative nucleotidyltransferase with HDIG domain
MYIHKLEGSWLSHTFWRSSFLLEDDMTVDKLQKCGAVECWINIDLGADVTAAPTLVEVITPPPIATPASTAAITTTMAEELKNAAKIHDKAKIAVTSMFQEARMGNSIDAAACVPLVNDIVDSVNRNSDALISLSRLKLADEYTYMHSVAVCALMVALGRQLKFDDAACQTAGLAGLLHDIGKAAIPIEVLNKPGKLTSGEYELVKQHTSKGHEMLLASGFSDAPVLDVVRHHHERISGEGYPDRLPGNDVSVLARMGAICDVYDAITSNRPYKPGWDPADSIAQMVSWKGHFDDEILRSFIRSIGIYPNGSLVRLTSSRLAIVMSQNAEKLTEPTVKIFFSTKSGLQLKPEMLNLHSPGCHEKIVCRESPENWPFKNLDELWAEGV